MHLYARLYCCCKTREHVIDVTRQERELVAKRDKGGGLILRNVMIPSWLLDAAVGAHFSISCVPLHMIDDGKSYECFRLIMIRYDSTPACCVLASLSFSL